MFFNLIINLNFLILKLKFRTCHVYYENWNIEDDFVLFIDAVGLCEDLLTNGSDIEILNLSRTILKRMKMLGVTVDSLRSSGIHWLIILNVKKTYYKNNK